MTSTSFIIGLVPDIADFRSSPQWAENSPTAAALALLLHLSLILVHGKIHCVIKCAVGIPACGGNGVWPVCHHAQGRQT